MIASMLGSARSASSNLNGLAELLRQAVVEVRSGDSGSGTGIIWGGAGLVVTNAHCIRRGAPLQVDAGGKWREAQAIAYHPQHDLALLASPSVSGPLLELRDPESLRAGELVFAHGHPLGIRDALAMGVMHTVTRDRTKSRSSMRRGGSSESTAWWSTDSASPCRHRWSSNSWSAHSRSGLRSNGARR
jgi:S1-C subfamily serine protease